MPAPPPSPIWAQEFEQLKPRLIAYLVRRGLGWLAEDVIARVALELSARYDSTPSTAIRADTVEALAWRLTKFRARDELRNRFVRSMQSFDETALAELPQSVTDVVETASRRVDSRAFLVAVAKRIDALSEEARRLVMREVEGEDGDVLTTNERVRLLRLRRALVEAALRDLKKGRSLR